MHTEEIPTKNEKQTKIQTKTHKIIIQLVKNHKEKIANPPTIVIFK